jgi:hypothetical protein
MTNQSQANGATVRDKFVKKADNFGWVVKG